MYVYAFERILDPEGESTGFHPCQSEFRAFTDHFAQASGEGEPTFPFRHERGLDEQDPASPRALIRHAPALCESHSKNQESRDCTHVTTPGRCAASLTSCSNLAMPSIRSTSSAVMVEQYFFGFRLSLDAENSTALVRQSFPISLSSPRTPA